MADPNSYQIGGEHYVSEYQHWDFVEDAGLGYLEGCATKYIARWRAKDGINDLRKARHYIEKIIDSDVLMRVDKGVSKLNLAIQFCEVNELPHIERRIITSIVIGMQQDHHRDLFNALQDLELLVNEELQNASTVVRSGE